LFSQEERKVFSADGLDDEQCRRIREHYTNAERPGRSRWRRPSLLPLSFRWDDSQHSCPRVLLRFSS
jgi:hypothetical protein